MINDKYTRIMEAVLTLEMMLYNNEDTGFIAVSPSLSHPYIHLTEEKFREMFGDQFTVDDKDPCRMVATLRGVEYIALSDRRLV